MFSSYSAAFISIFMKTHLSIRKKEKKRQVYLFFKCVKTSWVHVNISKSVINQTYLEHNNC